MLEMIDLGLSVKWASTNWGANSPEMYGDYFSWGEIETNSDQQSSPIRGVAQVKLNGKWRIPTEEEFQELIDNCKWTVEQLNNIKGERVVSLKNGNSIFLPYGGYKRNEKGWEKGFEGHYWTSSVNEKGVISLRFCGERGRGVGSLYNKKCDKLSIRPVLDYD